MCASLIGSVRDREGQVDVREGRIAAVGPDGDIETDASATGIDADAKYAIAGLADMRGHAVYVGPSSPKDVVVNAISPQE